MLEGIRILRELEERYADELEALNIVSQSDIWHWDEKNILQVQGPYGGGKTYVLIWRIMKFVYYRQFPNPNSADNVFMFLSKRQGQMRRLRDTVKYVLRLCGGTVIDKEFGREFWKVPNYYHGFVTVRAVVFGERGNDSKADDIQGDNLIGAFSDEADNMSPIVMQQLFSRFGRDGFLDWRVFLCSNPGGEWDDYQVNYCDNTDWDYIRDYVTLPITANPNYDNPEALSQQIITLNNTHPEEHDKKKFILGIPSRPARIVLQRLTSYYADGTDCSGWSSVIGIDEGKTGVTAAVRVRFKDDWSRLHIDAEKVFVGKHGDTMDVEKQVAQIRESLGDPTHCFIVDMNAGGMKQQVIMQSESHVQDSYEVLNTRRKVVQNFMRYLESGRLTIGDVPYLKQEMSNWHYPDKEDGVNTEMLPVKKDDHAIDAAMMAVELFAIARQGFSI